jgi:hypothetical protein
MDVQTASNRSDEQAQSITTDYRVQIKYHGGKWTTWATTDHITKAMDCYGAVLDADLAPMARVLEVTRTLFVDTMVMAKAAEGSTEFYARKYAEAEGTTATHGTTK